MGDGTADVNQAPRDQPDNELLTMSERIDEVCDAFERVLLAGRKQRIEDFLSETTEPERSSLLTELLAIETEIRVRSGERPIVEDYAERFPDQTDLLIKVLGCTNSSDAGNGSVSTPFKPVVDFSDGPHQGTKLEIARHRELMKPVVAQDKNERGLSVESSERLRRVIKSTVPSWFTRSRARKRSKPFTYFPVELGRHVVIRELGSGGMGTVYYAHDTLLDRPIALKVLTFDERDDAIMVKRFYREARSMANLEHPYICPIHDVGKLEGIHYLVMRYIQGAPLSSYTTKGQAFPNRQVAIVARKLALALEQAHQSGVIHRDLKPLNIMINKKGEPIILDFGLARRTCDANAQLTCWGEVIGTPSYMSPEQADGNLDLIGPATDIYSLGVIMYQLLSGTLPFKGTVGEVLEQLMSGNPILPSSFQSKVDPTLEQICLRAMAKRSENRYSSAETLAADLRDYLRSPASRASISSDFNATLRELARDASEASSAYN